MEIKVSLSGAVSKNNAIQTWIYKVNKSRNEGDVDTATTYIWAALIALKETRSERRKIFRLDEVWLDISLTVRKCWQQMKRRASSK